jgi:hypothetical protein
LVNGARQCWHWRLWSSVSQQSVVHGALWRHTARPSADPPKPPAANFLSCTVVTTAASALAVQRPSKALPGDAPPVKPAVVIPGASGDEGSGSRSKSPGSSTPAAAAGAAGGSFIGPPPTQEELAEWRAALGSQDPWSAGLPLLQQYYSQHGFGITSRNSVLRCVRWLREGQSAHCKTL